MFFPATDAKSKVDLSNRNLGRADLKSYLDKYQKNTISTLNLCLNELTPLVIGDLNNFILNQKMSLKELILHRNKLSNEGIMALASIINDTCLDDVQLGANEVGDDGVIALCEKLKTNTHLKKLSLSHNHIGKNAILAIVDMLEVNRTLEYLSLESCQLSQIEDVIPLMNKLLQVAYKNPTLRGIEVIANHLPQGFYSKFFDFYESKRAIAPSPSSSKCVIL